MSAPAAASASCQTPLHGWGEVHQSVCFFQHTINQHATTNKQYIAVTVAAPVLSLAQVASVLNESTRIIWSPPHGPTTFSTGIAAETHTSGKDRFHQTKHIAKTIFAQVLEHTAPNVVYAPPIRMYGGISFTPGAASSAIWQNFGDARFILPRWCYGKQGSHAWLQLTLGKKEWMNLDRWTQILERTLVQCYQVASTANVPLTRPQIQNKIVRISDLHAYQWAKEISAIRNAIHDGLCQKIVAARCSIVELTDVIDPMTILQKLDSRYPDCFRFSFSFSSPTFLGASPEQLVTRNANRVSTGALAGSVETNNSASASEEAAHALLSSEKDRREQALVVDAIARALAPLCEKLQTPNIPGIRNLREILHLETRIEGRLKARAHVLDVVAALHPTPAVGGTPTDVALRWIDSHETHPRGWYASPVGWLDRHGDGEFAVAIRSGIVHENKMHVYAGAGIVQDSDPQAEFAETQVKQRALLSTLEAG